MKIDGAPTCVRSATDGDLPAIEKALLAADLPVEGVAAALPHFVVVDEGAGPIALAGLEWHGEYALLRSVVVDPAARGRGLARLMVAQLLERTAACKAGVFLLTTTADRYFASLGFAVIDRASAPAAIQSSAEFASICPADATVMRYDALPPTERGEAR
jgi:amino-acid N-acetyltransferase